MLYLSNILIIISLLPIGCGFICLLEDYKEGFVSGLLVGGAVFMIGILLRLI